MKRKRANEIHGHQGGAVDGVGQPVSKRAQTHFLPRLCVCGLCRQYPEPFHAHSSNNKSNLSLPAGRVPGYNFVECDDPGTVKSN